MYWESIYEAVRAIYTNEYGIFLSSIIVVSFPLWTILMVKMRKRRLIYLLYTTLVIIYLSSLVDLTLFPLPLNAKATENARIYFPYTYEYNINLKPFVLMYFAKYGIDSLISDILNVLLFIPMGMLISFYSKSSSWQYIMKRCFYISLTLELGQLLLGLLFGTSDRISDINDLIMNTVGGVLGFLVFTYGVKPLYSKIFKGESIYEIRTKK